MATLENYTRRTTEATIDFIHAVDQLAFFFSGTKASSLSLFGDSGKEDLISAYDRLSESSASFIRDTD